jgi:hypothetical protein
MLDMWVIFVNISLVIGPVIHEERKAPGTASVIPGARDSRCPRDDPAFDG